MMYGPTREPAVSGMGAVYDEAGPGVAAGQPLQRIGAALTVAATRLMHVRRQRQGSGHVRERGRGAGWRGARVSLVAAWRATQVDPMGSSGANSARAGERPVAPPGQG